MKSLKRRNFLKYTISIPALYTFLSCGRTGKKATQNPALATGPLIKDSKAMALSRSMTKEQVFTMLDGRVQIAMEQLHNCAQSTFYSLSEQFGLGGNDVLKALTPLPGVAERGETCGAVTGALMAMGLVYGRDQMNDWEKYRASLVPTSQFCEQFESELGSTLCCKIQERAFGQSYNLMDPKELRAFQTAGATGKCTKVVQKACRLAAEIILTQKS
jgi:C_GCAxxG_C_C family probable redox protein